MWYLKVSSSLYIAVALICMIQNAISLTVDQTTEDQWSKLASSTDQIDLKKILKLCKNSINSFNEKLENTKTIVNKKLPEPNKTTEDIEKLISDVKTQIKNSSPDLVSVRKLVQKTALRFRDTFKSLVSFTELDNESVNKELEGIKKTIVDSKKPLVNRVVRSFGNRYDLNKLANRVLEISSDREKLKNNYDEKKKIAKKELNSLWNSLTNHSKTVNDNGLKAFETFFEGMKSLKSVKKKVKTIGEDAINEINKGNDFNNIKNAVELAKALKLKFEDEWNLDSGELTYSEEQKKDTTKTMDENPVEDNERDNFTNDIEPSLSTTEQETIDNEKINDIPSIQVEIEKPSKNDNPTLDKAVSEVEKTQLPTESENKVETTKLQPIIKDDLPDDNISENINSPIEKNSIIPNTENKENKKKTTMIEPKDSNNETNLTDGIKSDLSNNETTFNPDIANDEGLISPKKKAENNKKNKIINKRTSREKIPILPWQKLIQLDDPQVSQQSKKCESLLNNITPDFDDIKKSAKNSIQVTKNYKTLQKIENETIQRFYDKIVDTNKKLSDYLVDSAEDVCAKVTPINKRYETKFKNDPNIKRIKYLLGKQYDPNQYILKVLDDASHKTGIGGMKKTTYYKMLAMAHNLNHETKEMEEAALYAMNKIYEGKLAATNLQKMFNKEKASKACYIKNILLEKENDAEKKNKDENKEKVKESISNDINTEPLKPDVNLDSVDDIQPSTINDDNEPRLNNEEEKKTLYDTNESTTHNNHGDNENDNTTNEIENTKKENEEQKSEENYNISSIPQNKDSDSTTQMTNDGANKPKRNITRKVTHHRRHRNPNDPNDVSEEYDTIEEIDDEEDDTNEYKSSEDKSNITPKAESLVNSDNKQEISEPEKLENENGGQKTEENYISSIPQNKDSNSTIQTTNDGANKPKRNITRKVTHHRRHRNPNDPNDVSEEYDTIEEIDDEEDDTNEYKSSEKKSNITPEAESSVNSDNIQEVEDPVKSEKENGESNEEISAPADISDGDNSGESKTKRGRKIIDPKDGKEISEEYEEEDENKLNQPNEKTFNDTEKSEAPVTADNQDDAEAPEHLQNENVDSNKESSAPADISDGDNSGESKTKRGRKKIDPKDGKEISEEYEEENENKLNQPNEKTFDDTEKSEAPVTADNQDDAEAPEHLQNENVDSNEENSAPADISDGDNSGESKTKRGRKRIDPKDGKEISEEYEEEDGNKLNRPNEKTFDDIEKSEAPITADNQDDAEAPEHLQNENVDSNKESSAPADISDGDNSGESKTKRGRKIIDPKDGKEISEEYEEEDENKLNQPNEKTFNDTEKSEAPVTADNQDDAEAPEHLQNENVDSNKESSAPADISDGDNSGESKTKRGRKKIDPKDGKEISEEYEEEDGNKLNRPNEKTFDDIEKSEAPITADNQDDAEAPEHLQNENVDSNKESSAPADISDGDNSGESKTKRGRKRIDPKDGKEISEEYEEEDGNKLNRPNEKTFDDIEKSEAPITADNQDDAEAPEHLQNENVDSNKESSAPADISDGDNSGESKTKRGRKKIDPKDGKEISEEYEEEDGNKLNRPNEKTFDDIEKSEAPITADNQDDAEAPEHLQNENVDSNKESSAPADISDGDNSGESKTKRGRKKIDPKDGKEISEEYEEENENKLNQPNEKTFSDISEIESPVNDANQNNAKTPVRSENKNVESNEENNSSANISDGNNSGESKTKRRRRRIDPKDEKEISEENDTFEEDKNNINKSKEKKTTDTSEKEPPVIDKNNSKQDTEEEDTNEDITTDNEDTTKENLSKESKSLDENNETIDQENKTNEAEDLDENDDLNSVEDAEMKCVNNEKIIPAAESMGEDSKLYESSYESPEQSNHDTSNNWPRNDETTNINPSNENNEIEEKEVSTEIPNIMKQQNNKVNQSNKNPRRHKKGKHPKKRQEVSKEYDTVEVQEEDSTEVNNKTDATAEKLKDKEIKKNSEKPKTNQQIAHGPEGMINEENNKPSGNDEQPEKVNQPNIKNKRQRRPTKQKNSLEVPEDNKTDKQNEESPTGDIEIDTPSTPREYIEDEQSSETPEHDENPEYYQSNEHETETPTNEAVDKPSETDEQPEGVNQPNIKNRRQRRPKKPKNGVEVPDENGTDKQNEELPTGDTEIDTPSTPREYIEDEQSSETPEHDENPEYYQSNEHETETPTNEAVDKPSETDEQPEGVNQPNIKNRRQRRPKKPKNGVEVPDENGTDKQNEELPTGDTEIDTPSTPREYIEDEQSSETREHDENPEYYQSNEHETETPTNEAVDKPSETDEQPEGVNQPNIKNRRQRRPKKPKNGVEVPDENGTDKQNEELPTGDTEIDTPSTPREYIEDEQSSETPEHDENPEYYQSNEHETGTPTNEAVDKPNETDEQPEGVNQPNIKNRRQRRPKKPKNGVEVPDENGTDKQNEELPTGDTEIDTQSTPREYIEDEQSSETPEHDENPEYYQSNEHETGTPTNEAVDKPNETDEQPEGVNQPNRRHRRRRDPKTGLDISEEHDTLEEQDEEPPLEDNKVDTPEHDENSEDNQSYEHDSETPTNEAVDKPSDIGELDKRNDQRNRRHRRRRDPKTGLDISEEYDTLEEQDEEPPLEDNKVDKPEHDENSEDNQSYEHEPETPTNEAEDKSGDIGEQNKRNDQPNRRHRRRRDPKTGLDISEEYDTLEEQDEEPPLEDNKVDTPGHDENSEDNQSYEHEPETPTNEAEDKSSETDKQPEGVNQPNINNRRQRRPKKPNNGFEVPDENGTDKQNEELPTGDTEIDTPSTPREYIEDEQSSETPEHDENPEYYQSNEHETGTPTNEAVNKPNDTDEQPEGVNQPNRRHRRRRDPKTGLDISEEYDTLEEHDEEPLLENNKVDTPEHDENSEDNQSNEHESETPTIEAVNKPSDIGEQNKRNDQPNRRHRRRRDPKTGLDISEEYDTLEEQDEEPPLEDNKVDTPEHDENSEDNQSYEHDSETPTYEAVDKPSETDEQPEGVNQPNIKNRRQRRPKKSKNGLEVPDESGTDKQNEELPTGDTVIDTPSTPREYIEDEQSSETPEHDENLEYIQSNEHESETPTNEAVDKPSETDEQPEGVNQPNRRHRRRRDPKTGLDISEEYDTLEEHDEEPLLENNKVDTPEHDENSEDNQSNEHESETPTIEAVNKPSDIGKQKKRNDQPNRRHRRRRDPKTGLDISEEYDTLEEKDEEPPLEDNKVDTPEHDENSEDNQSYEHDSETPTYEAVDKPSETDEQPEGVNQPNIKNRRQRRPKKPNNGFEVSDENGTDKQNEELPTGDTVIDTPSTPREYIEDEQSSETPEHDENPEYYQSNEHETGTPTNEAVDKPNETDEQPEGVNQPNRRHRRRRDPKTGLDISEEYDTLEEHDEEPLLENNKVDTPEHDENSEDNQSNEHESETPTIEAVNKPSDIGEQNKRNDQPNRRHRRRRDPKTGLDISEEYDTLEEKDEEPPLEDNKVDTPEHDENSEDNQSYEHDSETPTYEAVDKPSETDEQPEGVNQPNIKNRRQRRPKKPNNGFEVSDENGTDKQNEELPTGDTVIDTPSTPREYIEDEQISETPEHDENLEYIQSNEHESETPTNEAVDKPSDIGELDKRNDQRNRRHRRRRDPKTGLDISEEYDTLEEQDEEPPLEDNKVDTPDHDESLEDNQSYEHDSETPTNEAVDKSSETDKQPEGVNQPNIKNRRQRRPKKPKNGLEVPDESGTDKQNEELPTGDTVIDTPSTPREYIEDEQSSETPVHDENPEYNQSNEHKPETPTTEAVDKPSETDEPPEGVNQPNRRHRRRRDPKTGLEISEEYDTLEEEDEEPPLEDNKLDTPEYDENSEDYQSNDVENNNDQPELSKYPTKSDLSSNDSVTPIESNLSRNIVKPHTRKIRRRRKSEQPQSVYENDKTPIVVNDENVTNYPVEDQDINNNYIPYSNNDVLEEHPHNLYGETNDNERDKNQPEVSDYPENSDLSSKDSPAPIDTYGNENVVKPRPRKIRRRRKSKQPQSVNENDKTPIDVNDENINNSPVEDQDVNSQSIPHYDDDVHEDEQNNGDGEINDNNQPEVSDYPENSDLSSKDSPAPIDTYGNENVVKPRPRKIRRRRKSKQPQSVNENDMTPIDVNDENINNSPVEDQDVNSQSIPHYDDDVHEDEQNNGDGEINDNNQPELSDYPENSDLSSKDSPAPIDTYGNENVVNPRPRKIRRRRKSKQPQSVNENDKTPIDVNDENINNSPVEDQDVNSQSIPHYDDDVHEDEQNNGDGEINDKNQPELSDYPENSDLSSKDSPAPIDTYGNENVVKPRPRKIRRRRKSKQPQSVNENDKTPIDVNDENINNSPVEDQDVNSQSIPHYDDDVHEDEQNNGDGEINDKNQPELSDYPENSDLLSKDSPAPIDTYDNDNVVKLRPRKIRRRRKSKQPQSVNENDKTPIETNDVSTKLIPTNIDAENSTAPNDEKSIETPEKDPKNIQKKPKKKRHIRRIRTYVVNKATNERIPINDQTYSTTNGLPDAINNKLDSLETDDSNVNDPDSNTDNDDYSSFLFKEYNSEQCKRDAYDRFKKVTSQDAKQIAYRSVLDTSEMRSNMLATIKNAIGNVKASQTFNDVDQSLRTISYSLKVGLKQTVSDLVVKVIPLAKDFLKTAEILQELYQKGPQSTHKMLTNILENESTVPESAKDILRLISPQFDVDELINNIFEKPCTAKSLKEKKVNAQRKLIDLSKHMDTAISNIDCFVLSAMSTVGIGADTLKLLKSGKVIMSDKHPRAKTLKDAVGIIKAGKKIRNNDDSFTPTLTPSDGTNESDEDDDDEDPDQVAQKNEEFLKTVPDLDDNIPIPKKVPNKQQSLGVIVVHPDKQIEYKEVTNTSQLKKFVGDQTKKYKLQSKNKHPKFLKLNSKQLINAMVADVKKKAERNGMTKKEMVDEIIKNLNSS